MDSPSLKLEMIGLSMMSGPPEPDFCGLAIRPRIPVSWLICALEPRAPESSIMYTELKPCLSSLRVFMAASAIRLVAADHASMMMLYRSLLVMAPMLYCSMVVSTFSLASAMSACLASGIRMSAREKDSPPRKARSYPMALMSSRNLVVVGISVHLSTWAMMSRRVFFLITVLM